jgi:glycerol-3-phosphate cytidylyltransferase-like family protein
LDTRNKIRSLDEFVAGAANDSWTAAIGVFDPFTVQVAHAIADLATSDRKVVVIVDGTADDGAVGEGSESLLTSGARAKMVASLRAVDAVVVASPCAAKEAFLAAKIDVRVAEDSAADQQRSAQFVQYVLQRQASAAGQKT